MPSFAPPAGDAVDLDLEAFTPPDGDAVDLDLDEAGGGPSAAAVRQYRRDHLLMTD
jgi:hypothetical protein